MEGTIPVSIPTETDQKSLSNALNPDGRKLGKEVCFREAIGSLRFLVTGTRPDLYFAVNQVSQFMEDPKIYHWNAIKRILKYLKSTTDFGILYSAKENF